MNTVKTLTRHARRTALASAVAMALLSGHAQAQQPADAAGQQGTLVKLIRSLIDSGALQPEDGELLLQEAQRGAATASPGAAVQTQPGDVRVPYIPQTVRDEIREEVRADVLAQAEQERWAAPDAVPEWTQRIRVSGDVRVRNESRQFAESNSNIEVNWSAINDGSGYDVNTNTNLQLPPLRNTRQDRNNSWRIRARLGITADLGEHTQAGIRVATGTNDGPVSQTQVLGGGLSKKDAWVDQAWLAWQPVDWLRLIGGRFDAPYWTTETLFSNNLNFDGLALQLQTQGALQWSASFGVTPLEYSSDSFPTTSTDKDRSRDKWLYGAQLGAQWNLSDAHRLRGAVAYYDFKRISGELSEPCALFAGEDHCSTDWSRPAFMQKGNTLMLLRNIALDPLDPANTAQPQYVGLAAEFELMDLMLSYTVPVFGGHGLTFEGQYIQNMAYDARDMWLRSGGGLVTNMAVPAGVTPGAEHLKSGDTAWQAQATFGSAQLASTGDWQVWMGYRYMEPDALPDAYNDADFHLGGTNAKGYFVGASWLFDKRASLTAQWFASDSVFGAPLKTDVFQLEVNGRF